MKNLLLTIILLLTLSGCRIRTTAVRPSGTPIYAREGKEQRSESGDISDDAVFITLGSDSDNWEENPSEPADSNDMTRENPDALRREYDENASAEIIPGTEHLLHTEGEGSGKFSGTEEITEQAAKTNENADQTALLTVPSEKAEDTGVSDDAEQADSAYVYYSVLLKDRFRSVYECKRSYVYWETAEDLVTIHKTSPEHQLILDAGAYDVSARLLEENLHVDSSWVVRKDPGVIVKIVGSNVLGSSVLSDAAAEQVRQQLISREGWSSITAVKQQRILLISEEALTAPYLRLAAALAVAKTSSPDLFEDLDLNDALQMLAEEATGALPAGMYFYTGPEQN